MLLISLPSLLPQTITLTVSVNHKMLRASNQAAFVQVQQPKIDGLQNVDVFEYHYMSELANLQVHAC